MMVYNIEFYAYLPKIWIYFFSISISGRIRSRIRNIFPAEPDPDPWKKMSDPHPWILPASTYDRNIKHNWIRFSNVSSSVNLKSFIHSFIFHASIIIFLRIIFALNDAIKTIHSSIISFLCPSFPLMVVLKLREEWLRLPPPAVSVTEPRLLSLQGRLSSTL